MSIPSEEDDRKTIAEEDDLVASVRGEEVSLSVMSDAAHEELWLPAEQYSRKKFNDEITADLVSSKGSENSSSVL